MSKRSGRRSKFVTQQKIAVGAVALIALGIVGYFTTIVVSDQTQEGFIEGEHYLLLAEPRRIRGDKIQVMEFFSYACVHCYNFDDDLKDWVDSRQDRVAFVRTPLVGSELWKMLGRAYYTMESLGILDEQHNQLFRQIHEARRNLNSEEKLADVLATGEVDTRGFTSAFNSPSVGDAVERADRLARRFQIATVPSLVVHGKYLVRSTSGVGLTRMLDVVDYLIEKERAATGEASIAAK